MGSARFLFYIVPTFVGVSRDLVTHGRMRRRNSSICRCAPGTTSRRVSRVSWARPTWVSVSVDPFALSPLRFRGAGDGRLVHGHLVVRGRHRERGHGLGQDHPGRPVLLYAGEPRPEVGPCPISGRQLPPVSVSCSRAWKNVLTGLAPSIGQQVRAIRRYRYPTFCRSCHSRDGYRKPSSVGHRRLISGELVQARQHFQR